VNQRSRGRRAYGAGAPAILLLLALVAAPLVVADPPETEPLPGGSLDPRTIPRYVEPLVVPPAMPRSGTPTVKGRKIDYCEIAVKRLRRYVLPKTWSAAINVGPTTVWSCASAKDQRPAAEGGTLNYPAFTIEASYKRPVRVKWINGLVDASGNYPPHLLPVDQTLHWANPGAGDTDDHGMVTEPCRGPVPIVTHVHGAHTTEDSDGYPEAWYLPAAEKRLGVTWQPGTAVFQHPNDQAAATLWYHDHPLGMTRLNVYAGPARFYLLRGGPDDAAAGTLPGPAPQRGDAAGIEYREIPVAIQDRSFNADGSLSYPDNGAFSEGLNPAGRGPKQFPDAGVPNIPFIPSIVPGGQHMSDISPVWNPELFGNTMVVNGRTWPYLRVEQQRYRLRFLNGTQARFLILKGESYMPLWQIGAEGGFLPNPVRLTELLLGPAERADVVIDFTNVPAGTSLVLRNLGPDEPFGGGEISETFDPAGPGTTHAMNWMDPVSETVKRGQVEQWAFRSFTADAHPVHVHLVQFRVVSREVVDRESSPHADMGVGAVLQPESWEVGNKDTVIACPGEIRRIKGRLDIAGLFVWHCHIIEHQDNETMRPYQVAK